MPDTKISDLTAGAAVADTDEFPASEGGNSRKKTASQLKTYMRTPTAPTVVSVGAEFSSTGIPTATLPGTHTTDDILVLVIQTSNEAFATPAGYTKVGPANGIGASATAGSTKLFVFWKRDGGAESAPTLSDAGEHTYGMMFAVRGALASGDPFTFGGSSWKFATSTAASGPNSRTNNSNRLIVDIFAHGIDNASGQLTGSATNSDLSSLTTQFNDSTTDGNGGGIVVISGVALSPRFVTNTTFTWSNTTVDVGMRLHFIPADELFASTARSPSQQYFIGSQADLDDTWIKPTGAKSVFVQLIDGGGSGSGGNTTTTAAGGGGGGGGGYDEAWYDADDLSNASMTLHAGKGGNVGTALNQAGNQGTLSFFDSSGPLRVAMRDAGAAATAAASADGGNGGSGSGKGSVAAVTTRLTLSSVNTSTAMGARGAAGGSGTTGSTGGSEGDWGGGGGESGSDTDAAITAVNNGKSGRGGGGGSGGRTNTNISQPGNGGGANSTFAAQGAEGATSTHLPYGGAGGVGGGSSVVTGGTGGFPGGGGGGGAGVAGGFGGRGGHGMVVVTTYF